MLAEKSMKIMISVPLALALDDDEHPAVRGIALITAARIQKMIRSGAKKSGCIKRPYLPVDGKLGPPFQLGELWRLLKGWRWQKTTETHVRLTIQSNAFIRKGAGSFDLTLCLIDFSISSHADSEEFFSHPISLPIKEDEGEV